MLYCVLFILLLCIENLYCAGIQLISSRFVPIDIVSVTNYNHSNFIFIQTVDAEITAVMPLQRVCGGEIQARNELSNGPLRAQSKEVFRVFCDVWADVICRGYDGILPKSTCFRESRWHRG